MMPPSRAVVAVLAVAILFAAAHRRLERRPPPAAPPADARPTPSLVPRLILLGLALALGQLWVSHHLGLGGDTPWFAGLLFLIGAADKALGLVLSAPRKTVLEARVRQLLEPVLMRWIPMVAAGAGLVVALWLSSVTVIPGAAARSGGKGLEVRLSTMDGSAVGEPTRADAKSPARFSWLPASPFGRPYRLAVDGYLEDVTTVYPVLGRQVTPERDLRRSPSVLFRPPIKGVQALRSDGSRFIVTWRPVGGSTWHLVPSVPPPLDEARSLLIGREQPIPAVMVAIWNLELSASNVSQPRIAEMLLNWSRPRALKPWIALAPGMRLVAEIRTRENATVARAEVVLGSDALIDVAMVADPTGG